MEYVRTNPSLRCLTLTVSLPPVCSIQNKKMMHSMHQPPAKQMREPLIRITLTLRGKCSVSWPVCGLGMHAPQKFRGHSQNTTMVNCRIRRKNKKNPRNLWHVPYFMWVYMLETKLVSAFCAQPHINLCWEVQFSPQQWKVILSPCCQPQDLNYYCCTKGSGLGSLIRKLPSTTDPVLCHYSGPDRNRKHADLNTDWLWLQSQLGTPYHKMCMTQMIWSTLAISPYLGMQEVQGHCYLFCFSLSDSFPHLIFDMLTSVRN